MKKLISLIFLLTISFCSALDVFSTQSRKLPITAPGVSVSVKRFKAELNEYNLKCAQNSTTVYFSKHSMSKIENSMFSQLRGKGYNLVDANTSFSISSRLWSKGSNRYTFYQIINRVFNVTFIKCEV